MPALLSLQKHCLAIAISAAGLLVFWLSGEMVWSERAEAAAALLMPARLAALVGIAFATGFLIRRLDGWWAPDRAANETGGIVEHIPGLAWTADAAGRLTNVNERFRDHLHVTDIGTFRGADAIHPEDLARTAELWSQCREAGREFHSTHRVRGCDGSYRWFRAVARPRRGRAGKVVGWYGTLIDIDDHKVDNETLRASQARLTSILDNIPGIIATADAAGNHNFANKKNMDYFGIDMSRFAGRGWLDIIHPEERERVAAAWRHSVQTGEPMDINHRLRRHDGEYRWFHARVEPALDANGKVGRWYGLIIDIDDRKRAEEALEARERQLQKLIDAIPALAWSSGPDGSAEFLNRRWLDYTGLSQEQASGWGWTAAIHPDDHDRLVEYWRSLLAAGVPGEIEARLRRFDGEHRWFLCRGDPVRDASGKVLRWFGTNTDIDDRKRAEEALRRAEHELRTTIDMIPALVVSSWPDGAIECVNAYWVQQGFSETDLRGLPVSIIHHDDLAAFKKRWLRSLATGEPYQVEARLRRANGEYRWHLIRAVTLRDDTGRVVRRYATATDIDDLKTAEEALRAAQDKLSRAAQVASLAELSASIAHEVNQPLAAVIANSHASRRWLSTEPPNLQRARMTSERIVRDAMAAADVVSRIRALFTQKPSARAPIDLNEVIGEVRQLMIDEMMSKGVLVETELAAGLPMAPADRVQMQQVLVNLIRNAIDAMRPITDAPRLLVVRSRRHGASRILVEVCDNGPGITEPERIFEPFFTTKDVGMGMGLAICRSIVQSHDGLLWAESIAPRGTRFSFTLPIRTDDAA